METSASGRPSGGDRGLDLLRGDLNRAILDALARRPRTEGELKAWLVLRSPGKLRRHLASLLAAGAIDRCELRRLRRQVQYSLTEPGQGLVKVIDGVEAWFGRHPERDLDPVSPVGWRAFGVLTDAWKEGVVQLLATGSPDLPELARSTGLSVHKLERELLALQGAGLLVPVSTTVRRASRYSLSEWGARGMAVLAMGSHWELRSARRPVSIRPRDGVAALSAALPLVDPPKSVSGVCTMTVEPDLGRATIGRSAAVRVEISGNSIVTGPTTPGQPAPDAWLHGSVGDWLMATVGGRRSALRAGGRRDLAAALLVAIHRTFYR